LVDSLSLEPTRVDRENKRFGIYSINLACEPLVPTAWA
ncbi:unnamed protein product, partial [marine sediment metagenome]